MDEKNSSIRITHDNNLAKNSGGGVYAARQLCHYRGQ